MQRSTFSNWFNDRLKTGRHSSPKVQNLAEDLRDGTLLIKLLENLTKTKIKGYTKNPKIAAHKLVNLDLAFEFMKKEEVKFIGIGSCMNFLCIPGVDLHDPHFWPYHSCLRALKDQPDHSEFLTPSLHRWLLLFFFFQAV